MALNIIFECPDARPDASPDAMWELQHKLDACAQELFGPRNSSKQLYQPKFVDGGPNVRNTPALDGGFAELSMSAAGNWPAAIYELAHETIHLLDPRPSYPIGKGASWLEEGLAVNFSLRVSRELAGHNIKVSQKKYQIANGLICRLGGGVFESLKVIRHRSGHFSDATVLDILAVVPGTPVHVAKKLSLSFYDS